MIPAWLSLLDAILAVVLLVVGVGGAHFAVATPFLGFQLFLLSVVIGALAIVIGIVGIFRTRAESRRAGRPLALAGTILGLAVTIPLVFVIHNWMSINAPLINDITTDVNDPPQFVKPPGMSPASMPYKRDYFAPQQEKGYGKLEPLHVDEKPDDAFARAQAVAKSMPGWEIVYADPSTRTVEGIQRSNLFRFCDDFVIQVRPAPTGSGSLVEMRSRSRDGEGDFGVNYNRIESFFVALKGAKAEVAKQA
jgi:uncharacterized protein (DUF1499 family)